MSEAESARIGVAASIANTTAAITQGGDLAGTLAELLRNAASALSADAAGILALLPDGTVEVLSASSHRAEDLELYQSQVEEGPCVESIRKGAAVFAPDAQDIERRWPAFSAASSAAGFSCVIAVPLIWQGDVIGGLNFFRVTGSPLDPDEALLAGAFADMAAIAIIHTGLISAEEAVARTTEALASRAIVEQAKGVLAYLEGIDMGEAYERLLSRSRDSGEPLGRVAQLVVQDAQQR
ncbi:MAG: hypothetical protein JWO63_2281 [Frankiales bacterium]|jgi:GAF domain-containing protein|nr:hypothetical protein [Frankiales bacterium]